MEQQNDVRIATLLDAYYGADYRWELDGSWFPLRIAHRAPQLEAAFPASQWFGLLSAWDPYSRPRPDPVNREADEDLHTALIASGLRYRPGFSSAPNRSWREPSWVVMDMEENEFDRLAQRFGQLGTLGWRRGEPIRLRMYARRPLLVQTRDCVDWVEPAAQAESEGASAPERTPAR